VITNLGGSATRFVSAIVCVILAAVATAPVTRVR